MRGIHMERGQDLIPALQMLQKIMLSSPVCYSFWTKSGGVFITSIEQFTFFSVVRHYVPQTNRDDWKVWKSAAKKLSRYILVQHVLPLLSGNICTSKTFFGAGKMYSFTKGLFNLCCILANVGNSLAQLGHISRKQ